MSPFNWNERARKTLKNYRANGYWPWSDTRFRGALMLAAKIPLDSKKPRVYAEAESQASSSGAAAKIRSTRMSVFLRWRGHTHPPVGGDIPFDGVPAYVGTIWDSTHRIFRRDQGNHPRWKMETVPEYRRTESLVAFDIVTDPGEQSLTDIPYEMRFPFPPGMHGHGSSGSRGNRPEGVRFIDTEMGIIAESLALAPWHKNQQIALGRLAMARRSIARRPPIPGVVYVDLFSSRRIDQEAMQRFVRAVRQLDLDPSVWGEGEEELPSAEETVPMLHRRTSAKTQKQHNYDAGRGRYLGETKHEARLRSLYRREEIRRASLGLHRQTIGPQLPGVPPDYRPCVPSQRYEDAGRGLCGADAPDEPGK